MAVERLSVERLKADERLIESIQRFPCLWEIHSKSFRDLVAKENAWKVVSTEVGYSDEDCLKRWKALRDRFVREAKKVKENMTAEGGTTYIPPWSLFDSMLFLQDSIRHRRACGFNKPGTYSDDVELEQSADGEFLSAGSPVSSVDLNASPSRQPQLHTPSQAQPPAAKKRKTPRVSGPITASSPFLIAPLSSSASSDPRRKEKEGVSNEVNQAILKSLKVLEETVQEQQKIVEDEDELFGKQVAMVMRRLTSKQKATAKLRIQQVFLDVEFPPETDISN